MVTRTTAITKPETAPRIVLNVLSTSGGSGINRTCFLLFSIQEVIYSDYEDRDLNKSGCCSSSY